MKTTSKFFATILFASLALAACEKGGGGGGGDIDEGGDYPPVEVSNEVEGAVMAGKAGVIEIMGTGFDPDQDYIYVGYDVDGEMMFDRVSTEVLTFTKTRISFGVNVGAGFLDKTVTVYLDRSGYDKMPISGEITFTMPAISDGYIPDPWFRATLNRPVENPQIAAGFDAYGMLSTSVAASVTTLELDGCEALSLEGLELFTSATMIKAWDMRSIVELDLSQLPLKGIDFRCERAHKLQKLITPPYAVTVLAFDCNNLTYVDASHSVWLKRFELTEQFKNKKSAVTYLDMRKNHSGTYAENPSSEDQYATWAGDSAFYLADNATIKIDSHYLTDHAVDTRGAANWATIYDSWVRGATIEVYSRVDPHRDELLGTVPLYSVDPEALALEPGSDGIFVNKFTVDDTYATAAGK